MTGTAIALDLCRRRKQTAVKSPVKEKHKPAIHGLKGINRGVLMLRITANHNPQDFAFQLAGKLEGPSVNELDQYWAQPVGRRKPAGGRTMKKRIACIVSFVVCFTLVGCASEQRRFTGFLRDYSILEPHPTIQGALVYWNPGIDPKEYKAVIVEPVDVRFLNRSEESRARPEDVAAFQRFLTDELTQAISKHAPIATEPGVKVLRCRLQVANLQFTRPVGEPQYPCLPPEYALGSANIETSAHDSISGELVVAYVSPPGSVEIRSPRLLAGPPDPLEAARTAVRNRIVTWTDHAARYFAPDSKTQQTAMNSPANVKHESAIGGPKVTNRGDFHVANHSE